MTKFCDNWTCPAMRSCAIHAGRSHAYHSMQEFEWATRHPSPGKDHCAEYRRDKARPWLLTSEQQADLAAAVTAVQAIGRALQ